MRYTEFHVLTLGAKATFPVVQYWHCSNGWIFRIALWITYFVCSKVWFKFKWI